jgi:hypothetical protein
MVQWKAFGLGDGEQPGRDVCQILDVDSLCPLEVGQFPLQTANACLMLSVHSFNMLKVERLGAELCLQFIYGALATFGRYFPMASAHPWFSMNMGSGLSLGVHKGNGWDVDGSPCQ